MAGTTALYLRISQDDDNHDESDSIGNQRDLLNAYVNADPILSAGEVLTFADDGWSGTNFDRPQVKALLDLVKRRGVQNIVVKDLSRWGRNYPEVNEYLDQIFPFLGVRFISVNDQYDSETHKGQTAPMDVAFSSIVYDIYSKELSLKVKQSHVAKASKGEYVAGTTPYGFLRSDTEKNRLVIDSEAADVVRRIFDMACTGLSGTKIAAALNAEGVDSPLEYRRRLGRSTLGLRPAAGRSYWDGSVVLRILHDERYTGTMVYAKTKRLLGRASGSGQRAINLPEEEWVKVPNAHEAIISTEQFADVRASRRKNSRGNGKKKSNDSRFPFTGKIVCGHCGRTMTIRECVRPCYFCSSVKRNTGQGCYEGKVYIDDLEKILLSAVRLEAQKALAAQGEKRLQSQKHGSSEKDSISSELKKLTASVAILESRSITLYEEFADGKIDKETYVAAKTASSNNLEELQTRITQLNQRITEIEINTLVFGSTADEPILRRVSAATEVTGEVLSLLDRIIVFDDEHIEIRFAFGDSLTRYGKTE